MDELAAPGMLVAATALLDRSPHLGEDEICTAVSSNLCRWTGCDGVVNGPPRTEQH